MTRAPSRLCTRRLLALALASALAAGTTAAGPALAEPMVGAAKATASADPRQEVLRTFAERSRERSADVHRPSPPKAVAAGRGEGLPSKKPVTIDRAVESAATAPRSSAADCDALGARVTQTLDHSHVSWEAVPGATSYQVSRQRLGGGETVLASNQRPSTLTVKDTTHNPLGAAAYTVQASTADGQLSCRSPESDWWSMSTDDGVGSPDVFFAGDTGVWEQDTYDPAFESFPAEASRPTFSANGQLMADVEPYGFSTKIVVRRPASGAVLWSVTGPVDVSFGEPAFSPDGQHIVVGAMHYDDESRDLYTIEVNGNHDIRAVPGTDGLDTPDWVDTPGAAQTTTIVAADLDRQGGLVFVDAASGSRTPLAGTDRALDPTGLPDGSVLFATFDGTDSTVARRSTGGTVTVLAGGTLDESLVRWPVRSPTGEVFAYIEQNDPEDPDVRTLGVYRFDGSVATPTLIGVPRQGPFAGFHGFDLRTKVSPGTSNLGGSPNPDILARSARGDLYAYPLSATKPFFDPRKRIGTGWNVMRQFVAAGDLNGDRRGDILAIDTSGALWFYPGKGGFGVSARTRVGTGWSSYAIVSTGDWDGDTRADLLARDSAGRLWLYPGDGSGGVTTRRQIGAGWQVFNAILGVGDWDYDGYPDLLAKSRSTGVMYVYSGSQYGTGGFGPVRALGGGWKTLTAFATPENWRGLTALFARTTDGLLLDYDSVGDGVTSNSAVYRAGSGWNPYTVTG